ncbi:cobW-domain-containing protein [Guyanagaster necrorhizus]|uniref:CobW-domain-containing protein n=1 Tax=Guyanagaster necrorhizus TaxID=856835 RepID=A0A9P7W438_9AGAR|nr:cobW-domain-containing protein [Guyanagaster necrorhizus MCA 3950]KAG7450941.1 cobW-domain-containing protein [Guyanagaster necrorhizus MCA 3950]
MAPFIPITVITGFLGAGKTTLILSLLPQLPSDYKVVLLKNEFGDVEVDSKLAAQSSLTAVSEILNGCMCCVLVGQMQNALLEIKGEDGNIHQLCDSSETTDKYMPDRIIIECSGSAFPTTLAFQIRELERETCGGLRLDAIITVIDAENFTGYEDSSPTAKMQSNYTDMILINKWEHVSERQLDIVLDHLGTLNDLTPKIRCQGKEGVDPKLIFGLETKLFMGEEDYKDVAHQDEVETVTILRGADEPVHHCDSHAPGHADEEVITESKEGITHEQLQTALNSLSKERVWRVKGFVRFDSAKDVYILNWAFGRHELTVLRGKHTVKAVIQLTAMGERGGVKRAVRAFAVALGATIG